MAKLLKKAGALSDERDLEMITLDMLCLGLFGIEYIGWESETLKDELEKEFGEIGQMAWEKIQAVRLLHANDSAWKEWEVFEKICAAANGVLPIFSHSQPPEPEEMAIAIEIMAQVDTHDFHEDIKGYIAAACLNDGMWYLDGVLSTAKKAMMWYMKNRGMEMDESAVQRAIAGRRTLYPATDSAAETQANRVILVRKNVDAYKNKLRTEMSTYRNLIKG